MSRKWLGLFVLPFLLTVLCSVRAQNAAPPAGLSNELPSVAPPAGAAPIAPIGGQAPTTTPARATSAAQPIEPAAPGTSTHESSRQTTVIRLQHMNCAEALNMVVQLMEGENALNVNMATDERTNAIVLRGKKQDIAEITSLVEQLDKDSGRTQKPGPPNPMVRYQAAGSTQSRPTAARVEYGYAAPSTALRAAPAPYRVDARLVQQEHLDPKLLEEFAKLEAQAMQAAKEFRMASAAPNGDKKQLEEQRRKLADLVAKAFEKRQELQQQEVKQLKERLEKVEGTLNKRSEHRQQIIEKRVADLLEENGELRWDPVGNQARSYTVQPVTVATQRGQGRPTLEVAAVPGQVYPQAVGVPVMPPPVPVGPNATPQLGSLNLKYDDVNLFRQPGGATDLSATKINLLNAESAVKQYELELRQAESQLANKTLSQAEFDMLAARTNQARARRDFLERELGTQLRLLELDYEAARARLEIAQSALKTGTSNPGASESEQLKARAEVAAAEYAVQKAKVLLDLHRNAAPKDSAKSDGKPEKKPAR